MSLDKVLNKKALSVCCAGLMLSLGTTQFALTQSFETLLEESMRQEKAASAPRSLILPSDMPPAKTSTTPTKATAKQLFDGLESPKPEPSRQPSITLAAKPKTQPAVKPVEPEDNGWVTVIPNEGDAFKEAEKTVEKKVAVKPIPKKSNDDAPASVWSSADNAEIVSPFAVPEIVSTPLTPLVADDVIEVDEEEKPAEKPVVKPTEKKNVVEKPAVEEEQSDDDENTVDIKVSEEPDVTIRPDSNVNKKNVVNDSNIEPDTITPEPPMPLVNKPQIKEQIGIARTTTEKKKSDNLPDKKDLSDKIDEKLLDKSAEDASNSSDKKTEDKTADKVTDKPVDKSVVKDEPKTSDPKKSASTVKSEPTSAPFIDASRVGDPNASKKVRLLYDEIINGLKARNATGRMGMWQGYARSTLNNTNSTSTGSEVDGRARLSWYVEQYNDVLKSAINADEFSRAMHHGLSTDHLRLAEAMTMIRKKLDVAPRQDEGVVFKEMKTPQEAMDVVVKSIADAQVGTTKALATLTIAEKDELVKQLVPTYCGQGCVNGHTIPNRTVGRRLLSLLEKMDRTGIHCAAESLIPLTDKGLLKKLAELPEDAYEQVMMSGQRFQRVVTGAGDILIGGRGNNVYDLDSHDMRDVVCVIDLGGNDTYREGTCNIDRPVLVLIDVGQGNDVYAGAQPGIQGSSILGVSMLINCEGNNEYRASDIAQGSTIGGAGILIDYGSDTVYKGLRRVQGHALSGIGMLIDGGGNDNFRAALWAQGFGAPGGFGVLENIKGNDFYYCGGLYIDSYPEHPGYDGWGQGVGAGIRQVANGGIGMLLEGEGDDVYEVDYFGQGGGYWLGYGIARDFAGNDKRMGTTKSAYSGGPRHEAEWTRFANGFGCHYSLGFCFDDAGDDFYGGRIMGTGMAWDLSIGWLCDLNGKNVFAATGGMTQGVGAEGSIGVLFTYGGDDTYMGGNQAYANSNITYHSPNNCGGNFSFVIDYGGSDTYGCRAKNNSYSQRGSVGGFLIDRPLESEAAAEKIAAEKAAKELAEKQKVEAEALEKSVAEIKVLLEEKRQLTQQQRQLWFQYQRQQQTRQREQQYNKVQPQQQIGSIPEL
ncbi:MAG: hypothetical protein LBU65_06870 [Planctomycetaceae bacterium]|nr:hypothetical protein [Planctomycetaceae bacterium]